MVKKKDNKKDIEFLDVFELIASILFGFNIIILGTWALPQMPEHVQFVFAFTILGAAVYVVFHALDKLGVMRDEKK
jgi:hypothetical protein